MVPFYNYSSRLEGGLGGDALGVQGMDVLAGGQHTGVPDGVTPGAWLYIPTLQSLQHSIAHQHRFRVER